MAILLHSTYLAQFCMYLALLRATRPDTNKTSGEDRKPDPPAPTPSGGNPNVHIPPGLEGSMYE